MNGGIDQLVDTYKGNPQPLQAKVQKAQQGQPPGEIPPDLEEAMALQKIAELRNSAQGQQAMQAGGAQQSVVEKLRQMLGGMQQQAQMAPQMAQAPQQGQMQGQPVMAAGGGSIDQLMSNLGHYYAGGGIVAFQSAGSVKDPNAETEDTLPSDEARNIVKRMKQRTDMTPESMNVTDIDVTSFPELQKSDRYAKALAAAQGSKPEPSNEDIKKALAFVSAPFAAGIDVLTAPLKFLSNNSFRSPLSREPLAGYTTASDARSKYLYGEKEGGAEKKAPAAASTSPDLGAIRSQLNAADAARFAEKPAPKPPAAPAPAAPRPTAGGPNINAPAKPAIDPNSLRALSEKYIRDEMGLNPESESDKAVARARKLMGLDDLLKEKEGRAAAKEKYIEEMKAKRAPLWIDALMSAGKPTRGGIAGVLGNMAVGASAARQNYEAEDLKYIDELNRLRDIITDAKITGNKELAKEALAAFKETDARRKAALTSATSLLNVDQQTEASNQRAREALAARNQIAAAQAESKKSERQQRQQNWIAEQERKWQDTLNKNPEYKKLIDQRSYQERLLYMPNIDPKTQEKAQAAVDAINDRIAKMLPTAGGGAANIPPPPKGAVTRVG